MEHPFIRYIHESFRDLTHIYGFKINGEKSDGLSYEIEYSSDNFIIRLEKYFREFYIILYKKDKIEEVNLFNLLDYLKQGDKQAPKPKYFQNEKDIEFCYRKQLAYLSKLIYANHRLISDFFIEEKYGLNLAEFEKHWTSKHPPFSKKWRDS